jgi:tetratricopeptide (TPR) repeat protein
MKMNTHFDKSREANDLRKSGQLDKALILYRQLSKDYPDPYAAAGLLHCLRKQGLFEEALSFCKATVQKYKTNDWFRREAVWALIRGKLERLDEATPLREVIATAESILALSPADNKTRWRIVRPVLKTAKSHGKWEIVLQWTERVNADELSIVPMTDDHDREGWCEQAMWQNYRIRSMIEAGDKEQAISLAQAAVERFPRQGKFFKRLEALATLRLAKLVDADRLYSDLCSVGKPEWWMLREHAQVLRELGRRDEALPLMCKAAAFNKKLDSLVTLFSDMGVLCNELGMKEESTNHLLLCKYVREEEGWSIPQSIDFTLSKLNHDISNGPVPGNIKEALAACRELWFRTLGLHDEHRLQAPKSKGMRKRLQGKLVLGRSDRPFCFISSEGGESFFCLKVDLPQDMIDGGIVFFDAIPSFDKKKRRESWKAINVRSGVTGVRCCNPTNL